MEMMTGIFETYDLNGDYLDEDGQGVTRIYVESKNLEGAGNQSVEFKRFLAQAYSATYLLREKGLDPKFEFMWATTCPWKGDGFRRVATWQEVRDAALWDSTRDLALAVGGSKTLARAVPDGHTLDDDLARTVADRIWVWVISDRHEEMSMGPKMRGWVQERLAVEEDV